MQSGLPVLANINVGNDLAQLIRDAHVGQVCESNKLDELVRLAERLLSQIETDIGISERCQHLFETQFNVENTVQQIVAAFAT